VPVLLRYTACQGLFNQMYAHLNALVLADYLGADVVLPPSVYRWVGRRMQGQGRRRGPGPLAALAGLGADAESGIHR
jgi:hypothetical protein